MVEYVVIPVKGSFVEAVSHRGFLVWNVGILYCHVLEVDRFQARRRWTSTTLHERMELDVTDFLQNPELTHSVYI